MLGFLLELNRKAFRAIQREKNLYIIQTIFIALLFHSNSAKNQWPFVAFWILNLTTRNFFQSPYANAETYQDVK